MVKKSISVTDQQADWIRAQIETGNYGNESEVFRDLIRDRISRDAEITALRVALIDGEQSGVSHKTVEEIWEEAQQRHRSTKAFLEQRATMRGSQHPSATLVSDTGTELYLVSCVKTKGPGPAHGERPLHVCLVPKGAGLCGEDGLPVAHFVRAIWLGSP